MRHPLIKPAILIICGIVSFLMQGRNVPLLDSHTDQYFESAMTKAGVAYGMCRGVNAVVSVIKESQIEMNPAGVGISVAAGQVLDPLDDLTERASSILVTAIVSLGIQKLTYELCVEFTPIVIAFMFFIVALICLIKYPNVQRISTLIIRLMVILIVARFCLPVSSLINGYLHDNFFIPRITEANNGLKMQSSSLQQLQTINILENDGMWKRMIDGYHFVTEKAKVLRSALSEIVDNAGNLIANLLKLSYLYTAVFVIQVILLPVGTFWIMVRLINSMFTIQLPYRIEDKL